MKRLTLLLSIFWLTGCATTPEGYVRNRDWKNAYESLEWRYLNGKMDTRKRFDELARKHPEIADYGFHQFDQETIRAFAEHVGGNEVHTRKLGFFCAVESVERCAEASKNVAVVTAGLKQRINILKDDYDSLNEDQMASFSKKYSYQMYNKKDVGVIIERQVYDASTAGHSAGSALGAAVGSTVYIDNAFSGKVSNWNYSAKGHLAAQLAGAIIGGSIADKAPNELYRFRYSVRLLNGNIIFVDDASGTPLGYPMGACIHVVGPTLIDGSLCK